MAGLTLSNAVRICEEAIAKAQGLGIKVAVSVVDSGTNLITMQKKDGTLVLAIEGSRGKAVASAIWRGASSWDRAPCPSCATAR